MIAAAPPPQPPDLVDGLRRLKLATMGEQAAEVLPLRFADPLTIERLDGYLDEPMQRPVRVGRWLRIQASNWLMPPAQGLQPQAGASTMRGWQ